MAETIVSRAKDGLSSLYHRARSGEFKRFIRFGVVGGSGVFVNEGVAFLGFELLFVQMTHAARVDAAVLLGIAVSIFTNFVLNDAWTWGDRPKHGVMHWFRRLGLYYMFSSMAACVQLLVVKLLVSWVLSWHYLVANLVGIGAAMLINYNVNNRWTFRKRLADPDQD